MYKHYQLDNKANVHLIDSEHTGSVTVLVMYPVGSRYEPDKLLGVSHYVEHLMFKGTEKRPDTLTLTREIDRLGAEYNAFTGKEYTGYYIKVDASYAPIALDILSDMLFNSTFDAKEMEREKTVIVEEIRMYKDNPLMNIDNIFEDLLYAGSKLGRDIAGTEQHVMSYERPDVLAYRDKFYQPANMNVIVAGALPSDIEAHIETYFGVDKPEEPISREYASYGFGSEKKEDRLVIQKKATDQAQLMLGFPGLPYRDDKNPVGAVLNTILGGSMSSRLFIQIRERRGLAYMVRSGAERFQDTGYFYIRVGLEAKNINEAIRVAMQEVEAIVEKGVTDQELADAKTHIRGSLTLSLEDSSSQANWYAKQILFEKQAQSPEERLKKVDAVTHDDIKALAKEIFDSEKMRVAVIGNAVAEDIRF